MYLCACVFVRAAGVVRARVAWLRAATAVSTCGEVNELNLYLIKGHKPNRIVVVCWLLPPDPSHLVTWYDIVAFIAFFIRGVKSIKSCTLVYMWSWGLISCLHGGA